MNKLGAPEYPIGPFRIFFQKFAELFAGQGAPLVSLTLKANCKKSSVRKALNVLFGHHGSRVYKMIIFILQVPFNV
jgi:hypothetical protein